MLALKSSGNQRLAVAQASDQAEAVFAATYPAIHADLSQYREALVKRQDQGDTLVGAAGVRAIGTEFDQPKMMYQEIQYHPCYLSRDPGKMLANNTVYFLPSRDLFVLAS